MSNLNKQLSKCKHPNSRKTLALTKQIKKSEKRNKQKLGQYIKQNLIGERIQWFRDNLDSNITECTPHVVDNILKKYLSRFNDELEQIGLKHSIGARKNRQHANREDIIKLTIKRELEEYNTCGIEMPDILNNQNLAVLKKWNGELRFLQNIKLRRIGKKLLNQMIENTNKESVNNCKLKNNTKYLADVKKDECREVEQNNCMENMDVDS